MNEQDFHRWHSDLCRKYPSIGAWFGSMADQGEALVNEWFEALAGCDVRDLLAVNKRMLSGDDPGPGEGSWAWQHIPAHVSRLAGAARLRRQEIESRLSVPRLDGPRYRCPQCQDSGFVYVAHGEAVKCVLMGRSLDDCLYRQAVARCGFCPLGEPRGVQEQDLRPGDDPKRIDRIPRFNDEVHFLLPYSTTGGFLDDRIAEQFIAWVRETAEAKLASKRHAVFDQYNAEVGF